MSPQNPTTTPLAAQYFKAPFRYDRDGAMIFDAIGTLSLDIRGWGRLAGKGSGGLGLDEYEAQKIQDEFGESVVRAMNAAWPTK
jgi:hypothetical protein